MHVQQWSKEESLTLIKRRETLLAMVSDAYRRMATNTASSYRHAQLLKCQEWLKELTELNEKDPVLFNTSPPHIIS